jgi:hypothetical protein
MFLPPHCHACPRSLTKEELTASTQAKIKLLVGADHTQPTQEVSADETRQLSATTIAVERFDGIVSGEGEIICKSV